MLSVKCRNREMSSRPNQTIGTILQNTEVHKIFFSGQFVFIVGFFTAVIIMQIAEWTFISPSAVLYELTSYILC
jgi:hypothetical protein